MGITISQPTDGSECQDSPLAVAAVAEITQFTLVQLQALHAIWFAAGSKDDGDLASREADLSCEEFEEALNSVGFAAADRAIFDRLFTLLDRTGDDRIFAIQFLIGTSALLRGSLDVKLQAALQFASDADKSSGLEEGLSPEGLNFALTTLASIAGFFGDPPVAAHDVRRVVDDVCGTDGCYSCQELVKDLEDHPFVQQYVYHNTES
ncbi:uncharacterized protein PITG_13603 [Phytophthora infestans T30-4]|uniref:EF-hand domain-containing protein n=2 Tax=Phytophthora infestans TaxID=4787 RepID=D0NMD3_PHYIT|nr:uncharacterized protein PITG_13603 [Phytophthora infestans T30-4]EEY60854.1 conserved hypothetical protein [Phytophthora infestans T30-4]KAF4040395.1 hypothetical protein GN244_ATG07388 [Phytophthora infestans]KAF4143298.1 hypothetical protein GN958_ATG07511 [Phytophthora infestans]|eukprot:XP_002899800.1 conserved hypothetical protein [Phytophthora infestans T30-4]